MQTIVNLFRFIGHHPFDGHKENTPILIIGCESHPDYEIAHILQRFYKSGESKAGQADRIEDGIKHDCYRHINPQIRGGRVYNVAHKARAFF